MIILKHAVHILLDDYYNGEFSEIESIITPEVEDFYNKLIKKTLKDDLLRKGKFIDYANNSLRKCIEAMLYDEDLFIEKSNEIANEFYDYVSEFDKGCDLAVVRFVHEDLIHIGIFFLEHKPIFVHDVFSDCLEEKNRVDIVSQKAIMKNTNISKAIISIPSSLNDEFNFYILDKDSEKSETESILMTHVMNAEKIKDDLYNTKRLFNTIDRCIYNFYADDPLGQESIRNMLYGIFFNEDSIEVEDLIKNLGMEEEKENALISLIEEKGIKSSFHIDREWIKEKVKRRKIKTDTGFSINGKIEDFSDNMKFSVSKNKDGSFNLIIKNIDFYI